MFFGSQLLQLKYSTASHQAGERKDRRARFILNRAARNMEVLLSSLQTENPDRSFFWGGFEGSALPITVQPCGVLGRGGGRDDADFRSRCE